MMGRILELKEICVDMSKSENNLHLGPDDWDLVDQMCHTLKAPRYTMMSIQSSQLTPGDFMLQWMQCKINLAKVGNDLRK
jgi:hypothetical protein